MINKLKIHDFKSHRDTQVAFCPGVNVFVGLSDHGKTNVIRAINWVANNRPLGDGVINRDATRATVELKTSHAKGNETDTIRRSKGGGVNEYVVNDDVEHPFTAFGSDPPVQIKDTLNLSEINIQRQFEPYFLVFDPPGQVAEFIRSITKLDEIDLVIGRITSRIEKNKVNIKVCESEMSEILVKLGAAARFDAEGMRQRLDRAKAAVDRNKKVMTDVDRLSGVVEQISAIKPIQLPNDIDDKLATIRNKVNTSVELRTRTIRMSVLVDRIHGINDIALPNDLDVTLTRMRVVVDQTNNLKTKTSRLHRSILLLKSVGRVLIEDPTKILANSTNLRQKYNEDVKKRDRLIKLVDAIEGASDTTIDAQITAVDHEIDDLKGQLTICPTCGATLDSTGKEKVIHECG